MLNQTKTSKKKDNVKLKKIKKDYNSVSSAAAITRLYVRRASVPS